MKNVKAVPEGAQNFWEWLVESLYEFLEGIIGHDLVKRTFWFFATIFIFILFANWAGLIPGVGTIGWGTPDAEGHLRHISKPLLRGVNADLNMTFAMAIIFFICWFIWALQVNGVGGFLLLLIVRHIRLESAKDLDKPAIKSLVKEAIRRSDVPFPRGGRSKLVIKSISPKQRPRRPGP